MLDTGYTYRLPKALTYYLATAFDKGRKHEREKIMNHKLISIKPETNPQDTRTYDTIIDMWLKMEALPTEAERQKAMDCIVDDVVDREE